MNLYAVLLLVLAIVLNYIVRRNQAKSKIYVFMMIMLFLVLIMNLSKLL